MSLCVCVTVFLPVLKRLTVHNKRTHNQGGQLKKGAELKRLQLCLNIVVLFKTIEEKVIKITEFTTNIQCFSQVLTTVLSEGKKMVGTKRHGCRKVCTDITCRCEVQTSCNGIQWIKQQCAACCSCFTGGSSFTSSSSS